MAKRRRSGGYLRKVDNFAPAGLPVGRAVLWSAGFGLSASLGRFAATLLPDSIMGGYSKYEQSLAGVLVAFAVRLKPVEKFIGPAASSIIAVTSMVNAVDKGVPEIRGYITKYADMAANAILGLVGKKGVSGLGNPNTVIAPREQLYGLGAAPAMMPVPRLTQLERKLSAIAA